MFAVFEAKRNSRLKEELHGWETKYTDHLGRRHRLVQYQCLQPRDHGLPHATRRSLSSNTRTLYSANLSRSRSIDKEPLSFSNNVSGSLSLSWLTSSGSCILSGVKLLLNCRNITNKNAVSLIVFSYTFSLSGNVFRYHSLRRVRVRSIPPNNSESSS